MRRGLPNVALSPAQAAMAERGVKAMIMVGEDRPFLDYIISSLADAGMTEVCLVIGPEHDFIRHRYTQEVVPSRVRVSFATQAEPLGTADAVRAAASFAEGGQFLVVNSDNLYPVGALSALATMEGPGLIGYDRDALVRQSNVPPERIASFALIWANERGHLSRVVEKPEPRELGGTALVSMNSWRFSPRILEACAAIGKSSRGEFELPDAVRYAITRLGETFIVVPWSGGVLDLSSQADVAIVSARLRGIEVRL